MLRFLGVRFGFDLNLSRRVLRILKLEFDRDGEETWVYAGFETPYPVPPELFHSESGSSAWHPWQLAWKDLQGQNPKGCEMLKTLLVSH